MLGILSADMCSLLYSYLGFVLSVLSYIGGCYMEANVVVVVGCNMVGTNNMSGEKALRTIRKQSLKINRSGCNSRSTTKRCLRMPLFMYEQALGLLFYFMPVWGCTPPPRPGGYQCGSGHCAGTHCREAQYTPRSGSRSQCAGCGSFRFPPSRRRQCGR